MLTKGQGVSSIQPKDSNSEPFSCAAQLPDRNAGILHFCFICDISQSDYMIDFRLNLCLWTRCYSYGHLRNILYFKSNFLRLWPTHATTLIMHWAVRENIHSAQLYCSWMLQDWPAADRLHAITAFPVQFPAEAKDLGHTALYHAACQTQARQRLKKSFENSVQVMS